MTVKSVPFPRTAKYANSFVINTTRNWNSLEVQVRNSSSLNVFKSRLKKRTYPSVTESLIGRASVHHTQMMRDLV